FLNLDTSFIPETYDKGYLYGHTENFLFVKVKGEKALLGKCVNIKTKDIVYPYMLADLTH
ncbi:MAG: hypothetical protein IJ093_02880, partial [Bacilli bacterium]|nr:hypothetical protein [Bacilli bacterium]